MNTLNLSEKVLRSIKICEEGVDREEQRAKYAKIGAQNTDWQSSRPPEPRRVASAPSKVLSVEELLLGIFRLCAENALKEQTRVIQKYLNENEIDYGQGNERDVEELFTFLLDKRVTY